MIGNASWISSYNARIDSGTGKVELLYNALVRQKTGEDWNNVRLTLSTAQSGHNGRMPVTIPADGQAHRANVTVLNLAGSPEYVTTPKLDSAVFLKVHLVNTSDAQLLPGRVSVFRDGEFTGMLTMNLAPSGSDFDLYAGNGSK